MARPTDGGRASMRVARPGKGRETVRTEAVGLQPRRSVTLITLARPSYFMRLL